MGLNQSRWVRRKMLPLEHQTRLQVQFSPTVELVTGLRSSSHRFRFELEFGTGRRQHYPKDLNYPVRLKSIDGRGIIVSSNGARVVTHSQLKPNKGVQV
jgi:hypothetical protein